MTTADDALFSGPPEEFVAARDELAARLKAAGDAERARAVGRLRRPTVAAWAVNLAVRRAPQQVEALLDLHRQLERAQRRMLSGVRDVDIASLAQQRREAVDGMVQQAADALAERGRDLGDHREDVRATFEALVADPEAAADVVEGRLQRAFPAPAGFGTMAGLSLVPDHGPDDETSGEGDTRPSPPRPPDDGERSEAAAEGGIAEAQRIRDRMASAAETALADARELDRRAGQLAEEARTAAQEAASRGREAEAARARADHAAAAARRAEAAAETATGRARRARDHADAAVRQLQEADQLLESLQEG